MRNGSAAASVFAALALLTGCSMTPVHRSAAKLDPKPYLLHIPGVGGGNWMHDQYVRALNAGGFDAATGIYDWTGGRFALVALAQRAHNEREAQKVAALLTKMHRADPDRPLYLSCESGGAGIAVWALERLPDDVQVEAALLLSPALSPAYDLTPALRHVRQTMLVFPSKSDGVVLGLGTSLFGTMDRRHARSAGMEGFAQPASADARQYAKLEQFPYRGKMLFDYGSGGGHAWALYPRFASSWLAPRLVAIARRGAESDKPPSTRAAPLAYASYE
jgi:alpha-beta hydrolase superfamily lysophospholipase